MIFQNNLHIFSISQTHLFVDEKNNALSLNRSISFEEISGKILKGEILDTLDNPTRENQQYFIMQIRAYTWAVPFLIDRQERIVLKTAFPSRKYHKIYGDKK